MKVLILGLGLNNGGVGSANPGPKERGCTLKRLSFKSAGAVLMAAGLGWFLAPAEQVEKPLVQLRRDAWNLPELPRKPDQVVQGLAVVTSPIFGAEPQSGPAATAPEDNRWRVAGVYRSGTERKVLISFMAPGKQSLRLGVGDTLPSGHRITKIDDSEVCMQIGKKSFRLGVQSGA